MSEYRLLLKREISEYFLFTKRHTARRDTIGTLLNVFLTLGIIAVVVVVYREFVNVYSVIKFDGIFDRTSRLKEILTLTYGFIIITGIFVGVKKINDDILEGRDFPILVRLPLKSHTIFLAKLTALFINQVVVTLMILAPLTVIIGVTVSQPINFWIRSGLMCFFLPIISLLIASILATGAHYLIRFFRSRFILTTVIFTVLLAGSFLLYQEFLLIFRQMIEGDKLKFFYNEKTMKFLIAAAKYLYPANLCAEFALGIRIGWNLLSLIVISFSSLFLSSIIVQKILKAVMKKGIEGSRQNNYSRISSINDNSPLLSLIKREFIMVIRTPSYAFQYFATILTMPLMVYSSLTILTEFIHIIIDVDSNFELTIFIIMMFSVLTNTFCASNISREGHMFNLIKTTPISYQEFVFSKIIFTAAASLLAILTSCFIAYFTNYITIGEMIIIFFVTLLISLSEIFYATRKDLNNPMFADNEQNEIKEATPTISSTIFMGLILTSLSGGSLLFVKFILKFSPKYATLASFFTTGAIILFALVVFILSIIYLLKGLSKKFYNTVS